MRRRDGSGDERRRGAAWACAALAVAAGAIGAGACGAKSQLRVTGSTGDGSGGDAGSTTSATTGASTTGVGGGIACDQLDVLDAVSVLGPGSPASAPEIAATPDGFAAHYVIEPATGGGFALVARVLDAFSVWPPNVSPAPPAVLTANASDYAIGPGPNGTAAIVRRVDGQWILATSLAPYEEAPAGVLSGGKPISVAGVPDRFLFAASEETGAPGVKLDVGSYQPGSLPQQQPSPDACISSVVTGGIAPAAGGFVTAFGVPDPPDTGCAMALYASAVEIGRFEVSPNTGPGLAYTEAQFIQLKDRIDHVGVAPASFGAWVVYQTAGLDAEVPPPIIATRVDASGKPYPAGASAEAIAVSPNGTFPEIAVAALGDRLAVAWADIVDPSAPTIVIRIVNADGTLGPSTSIGTNSLWFNDRLRLAGSLSGGTLLLSWESLLDSGWQQALARVDCLGGR